LAVFFCILGVDARLLKAEDSAKPAEATAADTSSKKAKISLAEIAPELYYQLRRYPKFYGDPNTNRGGLLERSQLLGSVGGAHDFLVDHGFYFDVSVTQFLQRNVSGGKDKGSARYNGTTDYWLTFDTGKAGLWSGGALFLHAESSWQANRSINPDVGTVVPANFDATMPTSGVSVDIALPDFYMVQALPANILAIVGKLNWAGIGDGNVFANNERTQFVYTGLVNNPILGAFVPYTSLGVAGVWAPNKEHNLAVLGVQSTGNATTSGFDNFNGDYTVGAQYQFSPTIGGKLPGNYRALVGYNTKDIPDFAIDPRLLIAEALGKVPVAKKSDNQTLIVNFDQYLWVKDGSSAAYQKSLDSGAYPGVGRHHLPPVGIGIFARAGWAPKDRNVIDQFYSFGVGGYGMLIPGRDYDQWGIGWAGTHFSSDLRNAAELLGKNIDSFGNAYEAFYNFQVTPALHLTVIAQYIEPAVKSIDNAFTLGVRLQIDL
jgi:carbohydrate-selective porin OprB